MSDTTDGLNIDEKRVIILDAERYFAMTTRIAELESEIARLNATGLEGLERDKAILQGTVWELQAQLATEREDNDADDEYRHTQMVLQRAAIEVLETEIGRLALVEMDNERLVAQLAQAQVTSSGDVREALAAYAHEAWSGWMQYLFSKCDCTGNTYAVIPTWAVKRWQRQMNTPYADLPEEEKKSDREEAEKMLAIVGKVWAQAGHEAMVRRVEAGE